MTYKQEVEELKEALNKLKSIYEENSVKGTKELFKIIKQLKALKAKIEAEGCFEIIAGANYYKLRCNANQKCPDCQEAIKMIEEGLE